MTTPPKKQASEPETAPVAPPPVVTSTPIPPAVPAVQAPAPVQPLQPPGRGGSYVLDPTTGAQTRIEGTEEGPRQPKDDVK